MVKKKTVKKKVTGKQNSKKIKSKKEPSQSQLFTKVSAVSESTKTISKEPLLYMVRYCTVIHDRMYIL